VTAVAEATPAYSTQPQPHQPWPASQVKILAKTGGDWVEPKAINSDARLRQWLSGSRTAVRRSSDGCVCLCVSAHNDEENELVVSVPRWAPTLATQVRAIQPAKGHRSDLSPADIALLQRLAAVLGGDCGDHALPFPTHRDDWLAQHREANESVADIQSDGGSGVAAGAPICILPVVTPGDTPLPLAEIAGYARAFFDGRDVVVLSPVSLTRRDSKSGA
jgi:hypothetical protein